MSAVVQMSIVSLLPILVIVAGLKDLTSYTIPNWISLALVAGFAALAVAGGLPLQSVGVHALAGGAALLAGMAMFALGWVGGGDAKLLAAICLWFGWPGSQAFLLDTVVAGGGFALVLLVARARMVQLIMPAPTGWIGRLATPGAPAPYGVAIALGALFALPASDLMQFVHISY
jgi:prepilin peptidase CpaA